MTTPISSQTAIQSAPALTMTASSPIGLGSQPTTLSSAATSSGAKPEVWKTVVNFYGSFADYMRRLIASAIGKIYASLGMMLSWFGSKPDTTGMTLATTVDWHLPPETQLIPRTAAIDPFSALPVSDDEQRKIFTIVHSMGTSTWYALLRQKTTLEQLGVDVQNVHPLKFLEYTLKHPTLKQDLDKSRSSFAWTPFIQGLSEKLRLKADTLPGCKAGFARSLNVNLNDLNPFFAQGNWEGMVHLLLDVKMGRKVSVWAEPSTAASAAATPTSAAVTIPITAATAAASAPISATPVVPNPTHTARISHLHFESIDEQGLTNLMAKYAESSRWRLGLEYLPLYLQWSRFGERHPIKLLTFLHSKPTLMAQLNVIFQDDWKKGQFMVALTTQLAKKPFAEVQPYIGEFATQCGLDAASTRTQIENCNWAAVVEDLHRAYHLR